MQIQNGAFLCSRFSYPPNSLSLCGPPSKKVDLVYYSETAKTDKGTQEILSRFSTLYPYLCLIAYENNIRDPLDTRVVEAYWLGNTLLGNISPKKMADHLTDRIKIKKILKKGEAEDIYRKLKFSPLPHHSFHVLNIYKRTGHLNIPHTLYTMDACLINWGQITKVSKNKLEIKTQKLIIDKNKLKFKNSIIRKINPQGNNDILVKTLAAGDFVSYHWGYFCQKLTLRQLVNLKAYTEMSLKIANEEN